jgi:A1 cistron-splicing factor AAR2
VNEWTITTGSSARRDADDLDIPGLGREEVRDGVFGGEEGGGEKELGLLPVDLKRTWREGAVGRERTEAAKDRSWALGDLVERFCGGWGGGEREVLGEVQVCFLMVVTVGNWSCMEQWKRLLGLLFTCQRAVWERGELFEGLIKCLRGQLRVARESVDEGGLFGEDMGFLVGLLRGFWRRVEEVEGEGDGKGVEVVRRELERLDEVVKEVYGWDLRGEVVRRGMLELEDGEMVEMEMDGAEEEEESGEYAPVVVDLEGLGEMDGSDGEKSIPMR